MKKVCVIGAGIMGSGIAAQIANSRTQVILLDIADEKSSDPSGIANRALEKMFSLKPAPLSHPDLAKYIKTGNLRDDLSLISDCDLIIEAIIEKLDIKHKLYESLLPYLKKNTVIASNTSTLPLSALKEKLPPNVGNRFIITHFFNPPRYMELLELITDKGNDLNAVAKVCGFIKNKLGKTIVKCNDTPGFIANRIGCFLLELTVREAIDAKLRPAIVDQIFTRLFGFPNTGIFGLYDLIGHDVMGLISDSLTSSLPQNDEYHAINKYYGVLQTLKSRGAIGRKAGEGFYKIIKHDNKTIKLQIDYDTMEYIPVEQNPLVATSIEELYRGNDDYSKCLKYILMKFFSYITRLIPEISSSTEDVDKAMKLGYSLKFGFFELLQTQIPDGEEYLAKIDKKYLHSDKDKNNDSLKDAPIILSNEDASLLEYEGRHIFVIKTKMNCLTTSLFEILIESVKKSEQKSANLIIYSADSKNFSVGADIKFFLSKITEQDFISIENFITLGQRAMLDLKYAKIKIISCAKGLSLGGGCEILLHSGAVVAHQNLNAGLVELGVGLIPAFGGTKEMFLRSEGNKEKLIQGLKNILTQNKSSSSDYFAEDYNVGCYYNMNAENILNEALKLEGDEKNINKNNVILPKFDLSKEIDITNFDGLQLEVLDFFQKIINMKTLDEEQLLQMEKDKFMQLVKAPLCIERIKKIGS